ncbi:hypothetical protein HDV06_002063 [Boothiomyces sp. JEL0866]|nr:hypothetical protein HDV06_002063 [Boothiomyces sp. JEL0866]
MSMGAQMYVYGCSNVCLWVFAYLSKQDYPYNLDLQKVGLSIKKPKEVRKRKMKDKHQEQISSIKKSLGLSWNLGIPSSELDGSKPNDSNTSGDVIIRETQDIAFNGITTVCSSSCFQSNKDIDRLMEIQSSQITDMDLRIKNSPIYNISVDESESLISPQQSLTTEQSPPPPLLCPDLPENESQLLSDHIEITKNDLNLNSADNSGDKVTLKPTNNEFLDKNSNQEFSCAGKQDQKNEFGFESFSSVPGNIKNLITGTRFENDNGMESTKSGECLESKCFRNPKDNLQIIHQTLKPSQLSAASEISHLYESIESLPMEIPIDPIESSPKFTAELIPDSCLKEFLQEEKSSYTQNSHTSKSFIDMIKSEITNSPSSISSQELNTALSYQRYVTQNETELLSIESHVLQMVERHRRTLENDIKLFFLDLRKG